ncbi:MAG: T9SS type A sorting domain-containing protein [Flavobacterium sp.]|uniref:T9SS type A sorting domain-containing protein n=1 Tax=Flavobacterium sp. TaxID=239 RepID=UPI0022C974F3|nr:T9SS type A sorting domain-containing protein [Flavobacterium sp.]MCZ8298384.1 T9SS type A sorting domain-containing protein [Flavobacterium sp.]
MKKTLKLIVLLLISNFGYSQIYFTHYLDQTSEWRVIEHHGEASYHDITFRTIFLEGLENFNGYTYYKMYQTYYTIGYNVDYSTVISPQSPATTQFIGYFREDPNGKFYLFNNGTIPFIFNNQLFSNGIETVFFDNQTVLNSQIGDMYFQACSIDSIDILNITTSGYKRISSLFAGVTLAGQALEGVGNIFNSCSTPQGLDSLLTTFIRIHCYTKQGQTYAFYDNYHLPNFVLVECNTFPNANRQGLSTLTYENSSFKIFPNPANTIVNITSNNKNIKEITLSDMQGRILKTIEVNNINTQLDISNYQTGTYLITIKTDYGTSNSKLIIE